MIKKTQLEKKELYTAKAAYKKLMKHPDLFKKERNNMLKMFAEYAGTIPNWGSVNFLF